MSSRKSHLTKQLSNAVDLGIYQAIKPLIEEGADVNGINGELESIPLIHAMDASNDLELSDHYKLDYILVFHALFECGADTKCLDKCNYDWYNLVYDAFGFRGVILFLQYGVKYGEVHIDLESAEQLSFYRAIHYNGGECDSQYCADLLRACSSALMKEFLMLAYDTDCSGDKKGFLKFLHNGRILKMTVEFVFYIDYVVEMF